jgi:hypothetical protein
MPAAPGAQLPSAIEVVDALDASDGRVENFAELLAALRLENGLLTQPARRMYVRDLSAAARNKAATSPAGNWAIASNSRGAQLAAGACHELLEVLKGNTQWENTGWRSVKD